MSELKSVFKNLQVRERDSWHIELNYTDSNGDPFDFTDYTPKMEVRTRSGDLIVDLSQEITLSSGTVSIDKTDTTDISDVDEYYIVGYHHWPLYYKERTQRKDYGKFRYDIVITNDNTGDTHTIFYGEFRILKRYTK